MRGQTHTFPRLGICIINMVHIRKIYFGPCSVGVKLEFDQYDQRRSSLGQLDSDRVIEPGMLKGFTPGLRCDSHTHLTTKACTSTLALNRFRIERLPIWGAKGGEAPAEVVRWPKTLALEDHQLRWFHIVLYRWSITWYYNVYRI